MISKSYSLLHKKKYCEPSKTVLDTPNLTSEDCKDKVYANSSTVNFFAFGLTKCLICTGGYTGVEGHSEERNDDSYKLYKLDTE